MRNVGYALLLALIAACAIDASYDGTTYRCEESQTCPPGFTCVAGVCQSAGDAADAGDADANAVDAPDAWAPGSVCGGLGMLRDDFADGAGAWGQAFPADAVVGVSDGRLRTSVTPTATADLRVGYRSNHVYALHGDAVEVELGLSGPGWAGVSVELGGQAVELTLTETMARCDRRSAGTLTPIRVPRDGATLVRIGFRDDQAWCEIAHAPTEADALVNWRVIGSHQRPSRDLAHVSLVVGGSAGQSLTAATFVSVNAWRLDAVAGWCGPGVANDQFDVDLAYWNFSRDGDCEAAVSAGDAAIRDSGNAFYCKLSYRQPLALSSGTVGIELGSLSGEGKVQLAIANAGGSSRLVSTMTQTQVTAQRCDEANVCTELLATPVPRDATKPWFGYTTVGGAVRIVTSTDAREWTTLHTVEVAELPFDLDATQVDIAASDIMDPRQAEYRIKTFATQP